MQNKNYNGNLYSIRIKYHPSFITCTEEHPFYKKKKNKIWNNEIRKYEYIFEKPSIMIDRMQKLPSDSV